MAKLGTQRDKSDKTPDEPGRSLNSYLQPFSLFPWVIDTLLAQPFNKDVFVRPTGLSLHIPPSQFRVVLNQSQGLVCRRSSGDVLWARGL